LIVIVGPTAVGKSDLALRLADSHPLEIISADSRQVYHYMDIGTSKPTPAERTTVRHHAIDVVDPDEDFSLAMYHRLAIEAREAIKQRGHSAFLVGGSGLYVWSLVEGWQIPHVPPDQKLRRELEARAQQESSQVLYHELERIDPAAAAKISPRNIRRIVRALEIYQTTGHRPSELQRRAAPGFSTLVIGLTCERSELYRKIDLRVDNMIKKGLIEEVEHLLEEGYSPSLPSMSGIGYRQIGQFLRGEMTLPEAVDKMKYETHRLARHQYAWFRLSDERIHWFDVGETGGATSERILDKVNTLIQGFMS
jgi:tRNA dimethylallyltransferase